MIGIGIGLVSTFLSVLLGVYCVIYYNAIGWFSVFGLSGSAGFTLWQWLKSSGQSRKERWIFSTLLGFVVLFLGACLIVFVPLNPTSTDKTVKQPVSPIPITIRFEPLVLFPIDVPPHSTTYVIRMHHQKSEKDWGMLDISNHGEQSISWPEAIDYSWRNSIEIEQTIAIDMQNESNVNLLNIQCTLKFEFFQSIESGNSQRQGALVGTINHTVNIPRMPASSPIRIYFVNQSPRHFMKVHFPREASLLVVGEPDRRNINLIKTGTHWIDTFQNFYLRPTNVRWRGSGLSD